jgi:hypothetical protein
MSWGPKQSTVHGRAVFERFIKIHYGTPEKLMALFKSMEDGIVFERDPQGDITLSFLVSYMDRVLHRRGMSLNYKPECHYWMEAINFKQKEFEAVCGKFYFFKFEEKVYSIMYGNKINSKNNIKINAIKELISLSKSADEWDEFLTVRLCAYASGRRKLLPFCSDEWIDEYASKNPPARWVSKIAPQKRNERG